MKFRVGYRDFDVIGYSDRYDLNRLAGCCEKEEGRILIRADQSPAMQAVTLVHELIHAMFHVYRIKDAGLVEEDVAEGLEGPLTALLKDNPGLVKTVVDGLNGKALVTVNGSYPAV